MLTFDVDTEAHALRILESVRMIKFAESLGGVETLITYPTTQTHADAGGSTAEKWNHAVHAPGICGNRGYRGPSRGVNGSI